MKYHVYKDKAGEWRWYLQAANGNKIANSGDGYKNRKDCLHAIDTIKQATNAEVIIEDGK